MPRRRLVEGLSEDLHTHTVLNTVFFEDEKWTQNTKKNSKNACGEIKNVPPAPAFDTIKTHRVLLLQKICANKRVYFGDLFSKFRFFSYLCSVNINNK